MTTYNTVSTGLWQINLPSDWQQKPSDATNKGSFYFEAQDGTKGAYFSVWKREDSSPTALAWLREVRTCEIQNLHEMPDSAWEIVEEWAQEIDGIATSGTDCLNRQATYRIVCLGLTREAWLARVSLHDYACSDYATSRSYFAPIIGSLTVSPEALVT